MLSCLLFSFHPQPSSLFVHLSFRLYNLLLDLLLLFFVLLSLNVCNFCFPVILLFVFTPHGCFFTPCLTSHYFTSLPPPRRPITSPSPISLYLNPLASHCVTPSCHSITSPTNVPLPNPGHRISSPLPLTSLYPTLETSLYLIPKYPSTPQPPTSHNPSPRASPVRGWGGGVGGGGR